MSRDEPRARDDVCGHVLPSEYAENLDEYYEANTWSVDEDGTHRCSRNVWEEEQTDRCIWHADIEGKSAEALAKTRSGNPERLDRAILRGTELEDSIVFAGCRLVEAEFSESNLKGANFTKAHLWDADLTKAFLAESSLVEANLSNVVLVDATLSKADLTEAHLVGVDFTDSVLGGAIFENAELSRAKMTRTGLGKADFTNANMRYVDFSGALMWEAKLTDGDLREANLSNASLRSAEVRNATLKDAHLEDADLPGASLVNTFLERANLTRANLFGANLTGAMLYGAVLSDVQLDSDTKFGDYYIDDAFGTNPDKIVWTLRQLERLFRDNALPGRARSVYVKRKDHRRRQYWQQSLIPEPLRRGISCWKNLMSKAEQKIDEKLSIRSSEGETNYDSEPKGSSKGNGEKSENDGNEFSDEEIRDAAKTIVDEVSGIEDGMVTPMKLTANSQLFVDMVRQEDYKEPNLTFWNRLMRTARWGRSAGAGFTMRYGESPWRVVGVSLLVILTSAVLYPLVGGIKQPPTPDGTTLIAYDLLPSIPVPLPAPVADAATSLYFSVVTFTTLGYGDLQPASGAAQAVATVESFVGALLMALLVFVLGRRATR